MSRVRNINEIFPAAKGILIILLALLTIYQTGVLWFGNIANRNFLQNHFPFLQQPTIPEELGLLVTPYRIVTGHGDNNFSIQYNGLRDAESKRYGDTVLLHLLQNGTFISTRQADFTEMLREPAYIFEYAFPMEAEWFTLGFGLREGNLVTRSAGTFRQIIIRPPSFSGAGGETEVSVFFISENGYAIEFAVPPPSQDEPDFFVHHIPSAPAEGNRFVSAALSGINAPPGQFVSRGTFMFYGIRRSLPYAGVYNDFMIAPLQNQLRTFFNNQLPSFEEPDADVWVFRDMQHTVVRYHTTHLLEYRNFHAINRSAPVRFVDNYAAAIQFLERDDMIINEFFLADFHEDERNRHTFYFNYVVANMPLIMCGEFPESSGLRHPLEITVDHGTVVSFRKLAYNFHVDENEIFRGEMDAIVQHARLGNVSLGYRISKSEIFMPYWCLESEQVRVPTTRIAYP